MSKHGHDERELTRRNYELLVQYQELRFLRAEITRLLFPLKSSPPRRSRIARAGRSAARAVRLCCLSQNIMPHKTHHAPGPARRRRLHAARTSRLV
jgi:hypothetical protein